MAVSDEYRANFEDQFDEFWPVQSRRMFGGLGIYADGAIFAILMSDGVVKLKGAGDMVTVFEDAGWERWTYQRDGADKATAMPYWTLPDALLDDPEEASDWARRALAAL